MEPGDVLAVAKLDRLSRSIADFAGLVRRAPRRAGRSSASTRRWT
jgi:DNA invertase Pin-like site-specific DNA recombinase